MIFRYIFIFLLIYFGLRLLMRYVVPILMSVFMRKAQKNFRDQFENQQQQNRPDDFKEGEVFISKESKKTKRSDKSKGKDNEEYIDF